MDGEDGENVVGFTHPADLWQSGEMLATIIVNIDVDELDESPSYVNGLYEDWPIQIRLNLRLMEPLKPSTLAVQPATNDTNVHTAHEIDWLKALENGHRIFTHDIRRLDIDFAFYVANLVEVLMRVSAQKARMIPTELFVNPPRTIDQFGDRMLRPAHHNGFAATGGTNHGRDSSYCAQADELVGLERD